jgi:hypothetical protein
MARKRRLSRALTRTGSWRGKFLAALAQSGNITESCRVAAVHRSTAHEYYKTDPKFAAMWDEALDVFADRLEAHVDQLVFEGMKRKKFDKGAPIIDKSTGEQYVEVEYPIPLIITRLKAVRPDKYRDNAHVEHAGAVKHVHDARPLVQKVFGDAAAYAAAKQLSDRLRQIPDANGN